MKDNKWSYKPLSTLCGINLGKTPSRSRSEYWGKGYSWVSIADLKGKFISRTKEEITDVALVESNCKIVKKGTLLMSFKLSIGKLAFAEKDLYTNEAIVALPIKDKSQLLKEYLYYVLKSIPLVGGNQAAMGQTLNKQSLSVLQIPLPPTFDDQKRIAKVLSQCESLIQKRKESIDILDELLKSIFLEMFRDEFKKASEWKTKLIDVAPSIDSGWSPVCESFPRNSDNEWAVLKLSCVTGKNFDPTKNKACLPNTFIKKAVIPQKGNLLFSRKNTFELVGATAYIFDNYKNLILPDTIFKINYNPQKINGIFLWYLLNDKGFSKKVRNLANGAAGSMPNISKSKLLNLAIPNPSITLQNKFSELVEKVSIIKSQYIISLKELENLYSSISQKAFKDELDLSKIDISDMEDSKKKDIEEVKEDITEEQFEDFINSFEHKLPKGEVPSNRVINIQNMSIRQYLKLPEYDEATEGFEFSKMDKDYFYQFILIKGFQNRSFTLEELERYARKYILRGTGFEFTYENWKTIIFRFVGAKQPIIEQVFNKESKTIELKLTDEAFKI